MCAKDQGTVRNNLFDLMRIIFAVLVILSHAPQLTDGNTSREPFERLTHSGLTLGTIAVDGFFILSGFLIVKSWQRDPELGNFLRNRVLRIVPGYVVAVLLTTLVVGIVAPGMPHFFQHLGWQFWKTVLLLSSPITPPVLPGSHVALVNGSLWTITYEFRCYLLVALFGFSGLLRRSLWLSMTLLLIIATYVPLVHSRMHWEAYRLLFGDPDQVFRMTSVFFVGGCFHLFEDHILFRSWAATVSAVFICTSLWLNCVPELFITVCGSYLLFYTAKSIQSPARFRSFPDISYGIYLYGWSVEALWIWRFHGSPWITFTASTIICAALGWLSWNLVERPMLTHKKRPSVAIPEVFF
jgi:peptidoglycan/LPS O-acetylase OafA/YrhL